MNGVHYACGFCVSNLCPPPPAKNTHTHNCLFSNTSGVHRLRLFQSVDWCGGSELGVLYPFWSLCLRVCELDPRFCKLGKCIVVRYDHKYIRRAERAFGCGFRILHILNFFKRVIKMWLLLIVHNFLSNCGGGFRHVQTILLIVKVFIDTKFCWNPWDINDFTVFWRCDKFLFFRKSGISLIVHNSLNNCRRSF